MKIMLDTHVALWILFQSDLLTSQALELLLSPDTEVYYSVVSLWEVHIKHSVNPQNMEISVKEFRDMCQEAGFIEIPIEFQHIFAIADLKQKQGAPIHKDPFDHLLLAQAKTEGLFFMTHDRKIQTFDNVDIIPI